MTGGADGGTDWPGAVVRRRALVSDAIDALEERRLRVRRIAQADGVCGGLAMLERRAILMPDIGRDSRVPLNVCGLSRSSSVRSG